MDDRTQQRMVNKSVEIVDNLREALFDAGGSPFSVHRLNEMSVMELIRLMALNNIHCNFSYLKNNEK